MNFEIKKHEIESRFGELTESQKTFIFAPERFSVVAGGYACVAPETLIEGIPIAERLRQDVTTFYGPVRPSNPFLKGRSDLYRVLTHSGSQAVVTIGHHFLTPIGWRSLASLRAGDAVAGDDISNVHFATERCKDFRDYCYSHSRQNDGLMRPEIVDVQGKLRQLRKTFYDDNAFVPFSSFLRATSNYVPRVPLADGEEYQELSFDDEELLGVLGWSKDFLYKFRQSLLSFRPIDSARLHQALEYRASSGQMNEDSVSTFTNNTSFWDEIKEISFVREGEFYDINVPGANHYAAQGLWHHNSGKSFAGCMKGLLLSATIPGNVGMIGRYRGSDLEESTMQVWFDSVCPASWIKQYYKKTRECILRNGSKVMFRHLHDSSAAAKTRRVGMNLGWAFLDQIEELDLTHWDAMSSRLRLIGAPKKFLFGALNPNGHDWIWERWFKQFQPWPKDEAGGRLPIDGKYYQTFYPQPNYFGIAVNSEEQRTSNGGFIEDSYFDAQIASMAEDVRDRYVYCSFDDFHGKLYKDFDAGLQDESFASVHNVQPFHPPSNWHCIVGIDIGGDSPWAVVPHWADEAGNLVVSNGFHNRTSNVGDVVRWIKHNLPWNESRTTFIIDPENKTAIYDLAVLGIHCSTAHKDCLPNILRVSGYMHVEAKRKLPDWYEGTQPRDRWLRFRDKGSPRIFAMTDAKVWRKEHDRAKWDPAKPDHMWKSSVERFDTCFVAGTPVLTNLGNRPIEKISIGEKVLTRKGWRKVVAAWCSDPCAEVVKAKFSNGHELILTPTHRVWLEKEFRCIEAIRYGMIAESWEENSSLTESDLQSMKGSTICALSATENFCGCTDMSGNFTTGQFPRDAKFTIKTVTKKITQSKIWLALLQKNISNFISIIWMKFARSRRLGTELRKAELQQYGQEILRLKKENLFVFAASFVKNLFGEKGPEFGSVPAYANLLGVAATGEITKFDTVNFATRISQLINTPQLKPVADPVHLVSVTKLSEKNPVYNITVEGEHEYYANGILVANCEATQYVVASRPEASKLLEAEKSYSHLAKIDPLSYREWNQMHKRIAEINYKLGGGGALREMDAEARRTLNGKPPEFSGKREW